MKNRIKIGIIFGGCSREREISFAGGRTVYDNLDKGLFEPIPIFVDSCRNFIQLDWRYLYQGTIRDFYPPDTKEDFAKVKPYIESFQSLPHTILDDYIHRIGKRITIEALKQTIDFAFLALHGPYGEDGRVQGLLEWCQIPYSGTGILGTALGIDKIIQKRWMQQLGYLLAPYHVIKRCAWFEEDKKLLWKVVKDKLALPLVVKSPRQGSSIGVTIVEEDDLHQFIKAVESSFFIAEIPALQWQKFTERDKEHWLTQLVDLRVGVGLPVTINGKVIYHPVELVNTMEEHFKKGQDTVILNGLASEEAVLLESFIKGREFSCIILQEAGEAPIALPPTEMLKGDLHFDYRAKYLPGLVRKETPMQVPLAQMEAIQECCVALFKDLYFQTYARIDGILSFDNQIYLNDPNTTAGMNPSSFLFHQAAEIGLSPSQLLTFLIRNSLAHMLYADCAPVQLSVWLETIDVYLAAKIEQNS